MSSERLRIVSVTKHNTPHTHPAQHVRPPGSESMDPYPAYFFLETPTVFPRRPVVLVCCPRTRSPQ